MSNSQSFGQPVSIPSLLNPAPDSPKTTDIISGVAASSGTSLQAEDCNEAGRDSDVESGPTVWLTDLEPLKEYAKAVELGFFRGAHTSVPPHFRDMHSTSTLIIAQPQDCRGQPRMGNYWRRQNDTLLAMTRDSPRLSQSDQRRKEAFLGNLKHIIVKPHQTLPALHAFSSEGTISPLGRMPTVFPSALRLAELNDASVTLDIRGAQHKQKCATSIYDINVDMTILADLPSEVSKHLPRLRLVSTAGPSVSLLKCIYLPHSSVRMTYIFLTIP